MKTSVRFYKGGFYSETYVPIWELMPLTIEWQIENRNKTIGNQEGFRISINSGMIFSLMSFIESLNCDILESIFRQKYWNTVDDSLRVKLLNEIHSADFSKQKSLFNTYFSKSYSELIGSELNEGVMNLYKLRNKLIHGRSMHFIAKQNTSDPSKTDHTIVDKALSEVFDYLKKFYIAKDPGHQTSNQHFELLSDKVIDHFYNLIKEYFNTFVQHLPSMLKSAFIEHDTFKK